DEKTEVLISGGRQRDMQLEGGRLRADLTRPRTVTSGYATASVRGTKIVFFQGPGKKTAYVRCYEGSAFVGAPGIKMRAGHATSGTRTTRTDEALIGDQTDWVDATCRILGGTNRGQERTVTAFDPSTGTVTVAPAFPEEIDNTSDYLLISSPTAEVVELGPNEGTSVHEGRVAPKQKVAPITFAEGQKTPWFMEIVPGVNTQTFPGTLGHQEVLENQ